MTSTFFMLSSLGIRFPPYHTGKPVKQKRTVSRARPRLRMELHRKGVQ